MSSQSVKHSPKVNISTSISQMVGSCSSSRTWPNIAISLKTHSQATRLPNSTLRPADRNRILRPTCFRRSCLVLFMGSSSMGLDCNKKSGGFMVLEGSSSS